MRTQVAKMIKSGTYKVIYDDKKRTNQYIIYKVSNGHQKKVHEYGDFESCMYYLYMVCCKGDFENWG